MLATPLNVLLLRALAEGTSRQTDLRRAAGMPAQTTLRAHLRKLVESGALVKQRHDDFPGALELELTGAGRDLLGVMATLEAWLAAAPDGRLALGDPPAKAAIKALAEGWSSTILRALAAKPLSLTELDRVISSLNYPTLERRLGAMRLVGQIEARPGGGRGRPYAVTAWLRQGVAPIAAATYWEHRHRVGAAPPFGRLDAEAAFLLSVPLLQLPGKLSGSCRLAVEISNGRKHTMAGVVVDAKAGRVVSCTTRLQGHPDAWTSGSPAAWLAALIDADPGALELGGDTSLARAVLDGLHRALFAFDAESARPPGQPAEPT